MEAEAAAFSNDNIHGRRKSKTALNFYVNSSLENTKKATALLKRPSSFIQVTAILTNP